jgi:hypothetical protein
MTNSEQILFNRLLWVVTDLNSILDAETVELIFYDLARACGKSQTEIAQMTENI